MNKVYQDKFGTGEGNCFQAAVASLFETDLEDIPHFAKLYSDDEWYVKFREFCIEKFGVCPICVEATDDVKSVLYGYHLASVLTTRGHLHSVVCKDGEIVHDPYPIGSEIVKVVSYDIFMSPLGGGKYE